MGRTAGRNEGLCRAQGAVGALGSARGCPMPRGTQGIAAGIPHRGCPGEGSKGFPWWGAPGAACHPSRAGSRGPRALGTVGPAWPQRGITVSRGTTRGRWWGVAMATLEQQAQGPAPHDDHIYLPRNRFVLQQFASIRLVTASGGRSDGSGWGASGSAGAALAHCGTTALGWLCPCPTPHPCPHPCTKGPQPLQPHSTAAPRARWPHVPAVLPHGTAPQAPLCPVSDTPAPGHGVPTRLGQTASGRVNRGKLLRAQPGAAARAKRCAAGASAAGMPVPRHASLADALAVPGSPPPPRADRAAPAVPRAGRVGERGRGAAGRG